MLKCFICDREYESGRDLTCSDECHARGRAEGQLGWPITTRSWVRIPPPLPMTERQKYGKEVKKWNTKR